MASQAGQGGPGGLKHAATEPSHLDNKREGRRRGAAGRAAVLRRAPSDSDCSGETASLSADSADRVRPAPPVTRQTKTRSRRRGSEWEVLEGLKDGQRFERRPEVFNGYLHKKRKWPLKGWHKRFFVVDGGILVYARSPTDVARGRLHGSVDVGLSVISAKARRRRIDIDADEFIYHLRAKTPDVFRTWLNVLKAHRLYRQHLLTFGARESVPKIHAPLEDLPPTDNSSPISYSSDSLSPKDSRDALLRLLEQPDTPSAFTTSISCYNNAPIYYNTDTNPINSWYNNETDGNELVPLDFESLVNDDIDMDEDEGIAPDLCNHSLCSMNCVAKRYQQYFEAVKPEVISPGISEAEKQINSTELDRSTPEIINLLSPINCSHDNDRSIEPVFPVIYEPYPIKLKVDNVKNTHAFNTNNNPEMTALFFFTKKKKSARCSVSDSPMKKSKKSTNVVKYKNVSDEPPLKRPTSIGMLLNNYHNKATARSDHSCEALQDNEVQATEHITKVHKLVQDPFIPAGYEKNIERLIMTILESKENCAEASNCVSIKDYVNQMVIEMQDLKLSQAEIHPVKILLKYLLEYWLKNAIPVSSSHKCARSVDIPSNIYFTRDKNESSCFVNRDHKQTQIQNLENFVEILPKTQIISHSFVKDRRIQELERVLKNTVYTFENASHHQSKEKDIEMTKKLIHNLDKQRSTSEIKKVHSDPSLEFPKIQETFDNLIRETSISPEVAKEFLDAYLHVLQNDSDRTSSQNNSSSTDEFKEIPSCAVQTESVVRRVSKKVSTGRRNKNEKNCQTRQNMVDSGQDPGQMYLKDILDKITTIFSKPQTHIIEQTTQNLKSPQEERKKKQEFSDNLRKNIHIDSSLISENVENNSVVIDLTKYDVEHISMMSDPAIKGVMSITIKLKERPQNMDESQEKNLNIKFSGDLQSSIKCKKTQELLYKSSKTKAVDQRISFKNPYIDFDKDKIELKPFMSSSDATSKAYRNIYENQSDNTLRSDKNSEGNVTLKKSIEGHDDLQSCFIMSNVKTTLSSIFQPKKKVRVQEAKTNCNPCKETSVSHMRRGEHSLSEKIAPKAIDEQFILLLLENLTLLSVNMPVLHKDISCLYSKLKKRHEKERRPGKAGVGLLGQIYKVKSTDDNETQFETHNVAERTVPTQCSSEKAINTDPHIINVFNRADKTTSIVVFMNTGIDFITQTDRLSSPIKSYNTKLDDTMVDVNPQEDNVQAAPEIVRKSKREWFDCISKKSTIGALFKCILDNKGSCQNFRFVTDEIGRAKPSFRTTSMGSESSCQNFKIVYCAQSRKASPVKLEKTMPKSGWSKLKQEIQQATQTERKIKKILRDLKVKREYNVYQLFVSSKFRTSTSLSGSNIAEWSDDMNTIYRCTSEPSYTSGLISPTSPPLRGPQAGFVAGTPGGRLASWIIESGGPLENATRELGQAQLSVQQLQRLLDALELLQHHHDTDVSLEGASPNVKKDRRKFGLRKKKSNSKCASVELAPPLHVDGSTSHMALSALTAPPSPGGGASSMPNSAASLPIACAAARPQSLPGAEALAAGGGPASISSLTPDQQLREDFTVLAKDLLATLKGIVSTLVCERGRLRAAMESAETASTPGGGVVAALRTNLSSALQQNSELRSRLSRIHDASDLAEISSVNNSDPVCRQFPQSLSYSSSCVSASEFFDAEEHDPPADLLPADETGVIELDGDSSSEAGSLSSEDGSASSDNSDGAMLPAETESLALNQNGVEETGWTRRTRLPCPRPTPGGPSLWNLLYKNIGKDLSQVSMPVTINEPLNMLQRLCEELEYSALLDTAAACRQGMERMSLMAAFAVSAYAAAAHRAASKPFNPLLHETYECTRPDRAFRFLAEQVSHHPPISACHAESPNWCFWQEARIKTKFWGKSMEFQPAGRVHVRLLPAGDHYSWNKVTTCVHNLFGGQRWVDQYGDMHIVCHDSDISCKLQFIKASSWSSSRHEIRGWVTDGSTGSRLRLHGRWSEALYAGDPPAARCLWRPGAMPPDHELYYGFTRFAMELNEMEPGLKELLPHTDTRFRPDQRALEEGDVEAAEQFKHELEQSQRERRRDLPDPPCWFRKSAEGGEEMWVFTGEYWKAREAGFPAHSAPRLW